MATDHEFFHDIRMDTAKGLTSAGLPDIRMNTARGYTFGQDDVRMDTARGTLKPGGFKMWEVELLESPEVRRKGTVAQLCEHV
jgi:cell cycle protein kinase DBF2